MTDLVELKKQLIFRTKEFHTSLGVTRNSTKENTKIVTNFLINFFEENGFRTKQEVHIKGMSFQEFINEDFKDYNEYNKYMDDFYKTFGGRIDLRFIKKNITIDIEIDGGLRLKSIIKLLNSRKMYKTEIIWVIHSITYNRWCKFKEKIGFKLLKNYKISVINLTGCD